MRTTFLIICLCFLSASCTVVYFEQPQPAEKKNLTEFPGKLRGTYQNISDQNTLFEIHKDYINVFLEEEKELKLSMNDNMIARKFRGDYYINIKNQDNELWHLYLLSVRGKMLFLKNSSLEEGNLEDFRELTEISYIDSKESESKDYILNPTLPELKKLVKAGFFVVSDTLVKTPAR